MYTANTMSSAIEAMGMSLPYSSSNPAISSEKSNECNELGKAVKNLLIKDLKPLDIINGIILLIYTLIFYGINQANQ